jgi:hypothetical protein
MEENIPDHIKNPVITPPQEPHFVTAPTITQSPPRKSGVGKKILPLTISFLLLVITGIGTYAGYTYYYLNPQRILAQAISNMANLDSATENIKVSITQNNTDLLSQLFPNQLTININSTTDRSRLDSIQSQGTVEVGVAGNNFFNTEFIVIGNDIYAKPGNMPVNLIGFNGTPSNDWVYLNINELLAQEEKSLQQSKKIQEILMQANYVQEIEKLTDKEVNGQMSYHFNLTLDKKVLSEIFIQIFELVTQTQVAEAQKSEIFNVVNFIDIETAQVWVSKKDKLPVKALGRNTTEDITVEFEYNLLDASPNVNINTPTEFKTLNDFIDGLTKSSATDSAEFVQGLFDYKP